MPTSRRRSRWIGLAVALVIGLSLTPAGADPASPVRPAVLPAPQAPALTPGQQEDDCWFQFMDAAGPHISCAFPAVLEDQDRAQIRKLTREVLQDARCQVTIDIERAAVETAVSSADTLFTVQPQPVSCQIVTSRGTLPVSFTFAPRIAIKGGVAVTATPGMANVTGVNSWIAWPVVAYINASGSIQDVMLKVTNAYLARRHAGGSAK